MKNEKIAQQIISGEIQEEQARAFICHPSLLVRLACLKRLPLTSDELLSAIKADKLQRPGKFSPFFSECLYHTNDLRSKLNLNEPKVQTLLHENLSLSKKHHFYNRLFDLLTPLRDDVAFNLIQTENKHFRESILNIVTKQGGIQVFGKFPKTMDYIQTKLLDKHSEQIARGYLEYSKQGDTLRESLLFHKNPITRAVSAWQLTSTRAFKNKNHLTHDEIIRILQDRNSNIIANVMPRNDGSPTENAQKLSIFQSEHVKLMFKRLDASFFDFVNPILDVYVYGLPFSKEQIENLQKSIFMETSNQNFRIAMSLLFSKNIDIPLIEPVKARIAHPENFSHFHPLQEKDLIYIDFEPTREEIIRGSDRFLALKSILQAQELKQHLDNNSTRQYRKSL